MQLGENEQQFELIQVIGKANQVTSSVNALLEFSLQIVLLVPCVLQCIGDSYQMLAWLLFEN